MVRKALIAGIAAVLLVGASMAFARGTKIPSTVVFDGLDLRHDSPPPDRDSYVFGHVESKKAACLAHRAIVVKAHYAGEDRFRLYGGGTTGKNGGFSALGPYLHNGNPADAEVLTLKPKKVGAKTCKGDRQQVLD